jgi:hypothetical protein
MVPETLRTVKTGSPIGALSQKVQVVEAIVMVKLGHARIICLQGRLHRDKKRHDVGATRVFKISLDIMAGRAGVGAPLVGALARYPRGAGARLSSVLFHPIFYNGRPAGTPSPVPLRLMKAPSRATLSPKGERAGWWGRGSTAGQSRDSRFEIQDSKTPKWGTAG